MNPNYIGLIHIDREAEICEPKPVVNTNQAQSYATRLYDALADKPTKRFSYERKRIEPLTLIRDIRDGKNPDACLLNLAERLLDEEKQAQESIGAMQQLQKGSLVLAHFQSVDESIVMLAKVEFELFLNVDSVQSEEGLPFGRKTFKSALFRFKPSSALPAEIKIHDSNGRPSKYWWEGFLEVAEAKSDEDNTKELFLVSEKILEKRLRKRTPVDYHQVRNSMLGFLRTKQSFEFDDFLDHSIGSHDFQDTEVDSIALRKEIKDAADKKHIDHQFAPQSEALNNKRMYFQAPLNELMTLTVKGEVDPNQIAVYNKAGKKGVLVYGSQGYNHFKGVCDEVS